MIAVASGKGGVGKSSVAVNLAAAFAALGRQVGVLDADIYGHSIPHMLGIQQKPVVVDKMIVPPVAHDLRLMSIGFFLDDNKPLMWRGPMLHRALEQFLQDVHWGELDVLVVDMPPGTGDVSISLGQMLPRAEAVVVTTPQPLAQEVAAAPRRWRRRPKMQLLGVIENMTSEVFGSGGGERLATELGVKLLGARPARQPHPGAADAGTPLVVSDPDCGRARAIIEIAEAIDRSRSRRLHADAPACLLSDRAGRPARDGRGSRRSDSPPKTSRCWPSTSSGPRTRAGRPRPARLEWLEGWSELDPAARPLRVLSEPGYERWNGNGALGYLTLNAIVEAQLADPPAQSAGRRRGPDVPDRDARPLGAPAGRGRPRRRAHGDLAAAARAIPTAGRSWPGRTRSRSRSPRATASRSSPTSRWRT